MKHLVDVALPLVLLVAVLALAGPSPAAAPATVLRGTVGPGFTIKLKSAQGKLVKKLKPGRYTIRIPTSHRSTTSTSSGQA